MICNIDKTWTLESKDIQDLNVWVAKLLKERAQSATPKAFDANQFVKDIYDQILDATKDEQKALTFAREIPSSILLSTMTFPEVRKALKAQGYDTSIVEDMQERFANSLQDVSNFISELSTSDIQAQANALNSGRIEQPTDVANPLVLDLPDFTTDLPSTALSTTGREIEERSFYYNFLKGLKKVLIKQNSVSADGTIAYVGVPKGIRITAVLGRDIPADQIYADQKEIPNIQEREANQLFIVVTDSNGNYVYFDDNFKVTTADKGKLVYFPTRSIPNFTIQNGKRVFKISEVEGKSIRPVSQVGKTEEDQVLYEMALQNQYDTLQNMYDYLLENPNEKLSLNFTGVDGGTINYNPDVVTPLGDIKNLGDLIISSVAEAGKFVKYVRIAGIDSKIRMVMNNFTPDLAQTVARLLLRDVYLPNGKKMSTDQRIKLIKQFTGLSKGGLSIDPKQKKIFIEGKPLDTSDKELAEAKIVEYLTREIPVKIKGKDRVISNQLYYDDALYSGNANGGMIDAVKLEQRPDGGFNYSPNNINYKIWLKSNAYVTVELDQNGEIQERNGYIKFVANPATANKIKKEEASSFAAQRKAAGIKPQAVTPKSASLPTTGEINDNLKALLQKKYNNKLFSMRHDSYSATKKQIEKAEKWYNNTKVTYKDESGNTVTKNLSEVVPLKVLFNFANASGDIRAQWTKAGITLFNGSDYTDIYHESWHAFTQLFMTPEERQKIYDEVKKLGREIKYYDHKAGSWKKMNSADLDFSIPEHMLYAEEFLADEYKEYAKNKGTVSGAIKSFFKRVFNAIKALFTGSSLKQSYDIPVLKEAFNNLHTGNLVNYTFNQQNIQFNVLNSGITALVPKEGQVNQIDVSTALELSESMLGYISEFVDSLNNGELFGADQTSVFTYRLLSDPDIKALALNYAKDRFQQDLGYFTSLLEAADSDFEKLRYNRIIQDLTFAIENFGDIESKNYTDGLLGFFNKRTNLLNIVLETASEDTPEANPNLDADGKPIEGNAKDGSSSFVDKNNKSAFQRLDPVMEFIFSTLSDREEGTADNPNGLKANRILGSKMLDPKTAFGIISSVVTNLTTKDEMYDALWYESEKKNSSGFPTKKALIIKQFLQKIGRVNAENLESVLLWNKVYHNLRYDRLEGIQTIIERSDKGLAIKVGASMSSVKSLEKMFANTFLSKNPSPFAKKDADGITYLDMEALAKKYSNFNIRSLERDSDLLFEFFKDFGIELTPSLESAKRIIDAGILQDLWTYNLSRWLKFPKAEIRSIKELLEPNLKGDNVPLGQAGLWKRLLNIEAEYNIYVSDEMIYDSMQNLRSEKFSPSSASSIVSQLNKKDSYDQVIANDPYGILDVYNINKNSRVKTSQLFQKMFGKNLQQRQTGRNRVVPVMLELKTILGTQLLESTGPDVSEFIAGLNSADSDISTAYVRDFFNYTFTGFAEAYKHADKNLAFALIVTGGDPGTNRYVPLKDFKTDTGRAKANEIILDYVGSELEFIRKTQAEYVTGENPEDVILGKKTLKDIGAGFITFDDILKDTTQAELIALEGVNTVDDFRSYLANNPQKKLDLIKELNEYFNQVIATDRERLIRSGLPVRESILRSLGNKNLFDSTDLNLVFESAVKNFVYTSFIHKYEMDTLIYGDPAYYNHDKDEHMKRVPLFFATGKSGLSDPTTEAYLLKNPGKYHNSQWFEKSGLTKPVTDHYTRHITDVAVLEDPEIESPYFAYYVNNAITKGMSREMAEKKYAAYKEMKIGDGFAWLTFDAYRALEISYDNWIPRKEDLYNKILNNEEVNEEDIATLFPVKKLQYSGWLKTTNFPVPAAHKFAVAPLIPTVIKNSRLELLHNKMVSQGISYTVLGSGSKIASIGKDGQLSKFYTDKTGQEPAFAKPDYVFTKNSIYKPFLKEQVKSDDRFKGKMGMPSQLRKIVVSGVYDFGFPVDFKPEIKDADERKKAWEALLSKDKKKKESDLYRLEQIYLEAVNNMIKTAEANLKMELGYNDPNSTAKDQKYNLTKLVDFFKRQLTARDVSEYDLDFIKIGSTGEIELPLDLATDPIKFEKLIVSVANKRVYKHLVNGDSLVQVPVLGYEKFTKPTDADIFNYGNRGLKFYTINSETGKTNAMEVKVALHGQFFQLLKLQHNDGSDIGTIERLNDMIKNEEWLAKGDHRKMITMVATRIPTQEVNFIDVMIIAEFLPPSAGPIIILPEEIVAKNGSDYDIDKMYTLKPVIKNNRGKVEYVKAKPTKKKLETILKEKAKVQEAINEIYNDYDEYIAETKKQKLELTEEQQSEINKINSEFRKLTGGLRKELNRAYDRFISDPESLISDYQELEDSIQKKIDKANEEYSLLKKEFFRRAFGENFLNEVLERRNKELDVENEKLRQLNREKMSYDSFGYQNTMMEAMTDILLSPEYFIKLTSATDTSFFIDPGEVVETYSGVNREFVKSKHYTNPLPEGKKMSPTRPKENYYNNTKAEAISVGKGGIGMVATDITFSSLARQANLSLNHEYNGIDKKGKAHNIKQFLLLPHNAAKDEKGRSVVSMAGAKDAGTTQRQVAEVLSQIANGFLEIAKNDFLYDVNIVKELETEAAMLLEQGVPLQDVVGLLSQPLVREYLTLAKSYNSPVKVATGDIENTKFAKYQALTTVLERFAPEYVTGEDRQTGEKIIIKPSSLSLVSKISNELYDDYNNGDVIDVSKFEERSKKKLEDLDAEDMRIFLHFIQINYMAKEYTELKRALNFDTTTSASVVDVLTRRKKILALSDAFPKDALVRLINNTILKPFVDQSIIVDAAKKMLPLRSNPVILDYVLESYNSRDTDKDVREMQMREFLNNLPQYILQNYVSNQGLGNTYRSFNTKTEVEVKPQALLKFGAFVDPKTGDLLIDETFIKRQFNGKEYATEGYGQGLLARVPSDMFSGYKANAYNAYRSFVIEREIARHQHPYDTILENGEFALFRMMRDNGEMSLPNMYEEFIRNKGLENAMIDSAILKTNAPLGIFSYGDQYRFILGEYDLVQVYPVLEELVAVYDPSNNSRFLTTRSFSLDGMQQTAYKSQIKRLADPAESKVSNMTINEGISAFFAKMPMVGFIQAGNNGASEYYIGTVVDNAEIAEFMKPGLDAFINDIENPEKARAILNDYKAVLDAKGRRTYYNYSSAGVAASSIAKNNRQETNFILQGSSVKLGATQEFVNNSGGAKGADAYFNFKSSNYPVSNMNWHNQAMLDRSKAGQEPDLVLGLLENNPQALITDESEYPNVVSIGAARLGKHAKKPETINKLGRNWYQVKNADAIFAVVENFYTRPDTKTLDRSNVAGGTGWAVAYTAEKIDGIERPIFVFNQSDEKWYSYNYNKNIFEEYLGVPKLTPNFAGIGTRKLNDAGKRAIDALYANTFGATQVVPSNKVVEGNIFTLPGIPVITTNLGGVHGAGLAQAAKAKGLIKQGEGQFSASESVVTLPVKLKWSDDMSMNNNMELLTESLRSLIKVAKANPQNNYLLPLAGLGHGEGVVEEILPLLIKTVVASSNIQLVLPAEGVNLGRQGSVRKDATRQNMPQIKAMLSEAGLLTTQPSTGISVVSEDYGVVVAETNPSEEKTKQFVEILLPQIKAQAYKENASGTANDMFMYGLRWTRKKGAIKPLNNRSYANGGLPVTNAKAKDGYVYDTVDQNGNPLPSVTDLQPIINEIQSTLGIDMSDYDAVIANIYLPGQNVATHRDTTESLSARNYPVVVYTIGNNSAINIYENVKDPGKASFANDKMTSIPTKNGSIYTFGMDGNGRFEMAHDTPRGVKRDQAFPPITLPDGTVVENYTITLTFRRAADLLPGMPTAPRKIADRMPARGKTTIVSDANKQFENIAINQVGPDTRINYETGEIEEVAKLYDENKFIKDGRYDLTTTNIKTLFAEYPDDVFVFDDLYTKEEDRFRLLPKSNTREVWRMGLAAGNSFAISTKLSGGISPTDEKFEKMKEIIDKQIDQLKELKASGKTIRFSKIGVAQNWAGWNYILDGRFTKANNTPAPNAFVYLSKRLFDEFGYKNPRFDAITTSADIDKGITGGLTGFEYYQEEYKNQGAQTMTDKEIVEFIKMCKGLQ